MHYLLNLLTPEQQNRIKISHYKKDDILYREDDYCDEITIVLEGVIEISSFSFQGQKLIYNTVLPNQLFGNNLIFSSDPKYKGNVIANTKSKVAIIKKDILVDIISHNKEFLKEYLKIQSDFGKTLNDKIKILSFKSAEERLLYYLKIHDNKVRVNSIAFLAKELSLSREATSRLISGLHNKSIISKDIISNKIIITKL